MINEIQNRSESEKNAIADKINDRDLLSCRSKIN